MKICSTCKENLPTSSFSKKSQNKDGLSGICRSCISILSRKKYERDREKLKQKSKENRMKNPNYNKEYYCKNLDYFKTYNDNTAEKRKQWQKDNMNRIQETRRIRWEKNPELKLKARLRSYYWFHLKKSKTGKTNSSIKLLGCSIQDFKSYLENKFQIGMSWDNHGEWHLDHIKPCASFDISDPVQLGECFHYTNFQPLWAKDNLQKGKKY